MNKGGSWFVQEGQQQGILIGHNAISSQVGCTDDANEFICGIVWGLMPPSGLDPDNLTRQMMLKSSDIQFRTVTPSNQPPVCSTLPLILNHIKPYYTLLSCSEMYRFSIRSGFLECASIHGQCRHCKSVCEKHTRYGDKSHNQPTIQKIGRGASQVSDEQFGRLWDVHSQGYRGLIP